MDTTGRTFWNHPTARWIAVLPGAIIATILVGILMNLIVAVMGMSSGTWFGIEVTSDDPNSQVGKGLGYHILKYFMRPMFMGGGFVYAAKSIAPSHKKIVAWIFTLIIFVITGLFFTYIRKVSNDGIGLWNWLILISLPIGAISGANYRYKE